MDAHTDDDDDGNGLLDTTAVECPALMPAGFRGRGLIRGRVAN